MLVFCGKAKHKIGGKILRVNGESYALPLGAGLWEKSPMTGDTPNQRPISDVAGVLRRVMAEQGLTAYEWQQRLNHHRGRSGSNLKNILSGAKQRSVTLDVLDGLAVTAGFDDYVHMASGRPRIDTALLREAVIEAAELLKKGPFEMSAEDAADLVIEALKHYSGAARGPQELRRAMQMSLSGKANKAPAG